MRKLETILDACIEGLTGRRTDHNRLTDAEYFANITRTAADSPDKLRCVDVDRVLSCVKHKEIIPYKAWLLGHKVNPDTAQAIRLWQPETGPDYTVIVRPETLTDQSVAWNVEIMSDGGSMAFHPLDECKARWMAQEISNAIEKATSASVEVR